MFVLRPEHEAAFGAAGLARFHRRAVRMLRARHAADLADLPDQNVLELAEVWMREARRWGMRTERQMMRYMTCQIYLRRRTVTPAMKSLLDNCLRTHRSSPAQGSQELVRIAAIWAHESQPQYWNDPA